MPSKPTPSPPLVLVLDNIRSGYNVGATFRISDAFAIQHIYLCGITPTPPHREIRKTALGAEETVPWTYISTTLDALTTLQSQGYQVICIEKTATALPLDLSTRHDQTLPTALVFGHEVWGISQEVLALANLTLAIPQYGHKHSLNVASCIAILTWEWTRRN